MKRKQTKTIHEGEYVAQVEIELIGYETMAGHLYCGWSMPTDLDFIRQALRTGTIKVEIGAGILHLHRLQRSNPPAESIRCLRLWQLWETF